jgi:hypothetical protein
VGAEEAMTENEDKDDLDDRAFAGIMLAEKRFEKLFTGKGNGFGSLLGFDFQKMEKPAGEAFVLKTEWSERDRGDAS